MGSGYRKKTTEFFILWEVLFFLAGLLFYRSIFGIIPGFVLYPIGCLVMKRSAIQKYKRVVLNSFPDFIYILASQVAAGKSLPKSLLDTDERLKALYNPDSPLLVLSGRICSCITGGFSVTGALRECLVSSGIPELNLFSDIVQTTVETGGNMEHALMKLDRILSRKIEDEKDILSNLETKRLEVIILVAIPIFLLCFLSITSEDYIRMFYTTIFGRVMMTLVLLMIVFSVLWSWRMIETVWED